MRAIRILVTAGPTREPIDPVRFISNYSTGAMGYAIAKAANEKGHGVILITGPTHISPPRGIEAIPITTAREMFEAVRSHVKRADCVVMAAAVSDFRPAAYRDKKIKRKGRLQNLGLCRNVDILHWLKQHRGGRILIGFCMETEDAISNARKKLFEKRLDMIVANKVDRNKSAFGPGRTNVVMMEPGGKQERLIGASKERIARILLDKIEELWYKKHAGERRIKKQRAQLP